MLRRKENRLLGEHGEGFRENLWVFEHEESCLSTAQKSKSAKDEASPDTLRAACFSSACEECHGWTVADCGSYLWRAVVWDPPAELLLSSSPNPALPAVTWRRREDSFIWSMIMRVSHNNTCISNVQYIQLVPPMETCESQQSESCFVNLTSQKPNKVTAVILHTACSCLLSQPICELRDQDFKEEKYFILMSSIVSGWSTWLEA